MHGQVTSNRSGELTVPNRRIQTTKPHNPFNTDDRTKKPYVPYETVRIEVEFGYRAAKDQIRPYRRSRRL